jgi:hypothetical protein
MAGCSTALEADCQKIFGEDSAFYDDQAAMAMKTPEQATAPVLLDDLPLARFDDHHTSIEAAIPACGLTRICHDRSTSYAANSDS